MQADGLTIDEQRSFRLYARPGNRCAQTLSTNFGRPLEGQPRVDEPRTRVPCDSNRNATHDRERLPGFVPQRLSWQGATRAEEVTAMRWEKPKIVVEGSFVERCDASPSASVSVTRGT